MYIYIYIYIYPACVEARSWLRACTDARAAVSVMRGRTKTGREWIPFGDHPLKLERYREY